jgi:hypothetical protein
MMVLRALAALLLLTSAALGQNLSGTGSPVLRSYIAGYTLSNDSGTPNSVLDIAAGQAADSANTIYITLGAFTKSTAGTWVAGSAANGMGASLTVGNSTWYHVCAIINAGAADVYFDTDAACTTNAPASTTARRRIGSFLTDGSAHIVAFKQDGESFYWGAQVLDLNAVNINNTTSLNALSVPLGVKTRPMIRVGVSAATVVISSPDEPDSAPVVAGVNEDVNTNLSTGANDRYSNTSSQLRFHTNANTNVSVNTRGWIDDRGKFN